MTLREFEIGARLGAGGQGHTLRATERATGAAVVIKELDLAHVESVKALELFEREAHVLRRLDHPAVPGYVASFSEAGDDGVMRHYLVQRLVEGPTLQQAIDDGRRWTEEAATDTLRKLLSLLVYLHAQEPPVLHRDIKPANIILGGPEELSLVDFGAALLVSRETMASARTQTVIGTTGYMAPEQFTGRAVPASDLYGVGTTVLHMLTGRHPADLPMSGLRLEFERYLNVSPGLSMFIARLVAPALEDRFPTAAEALNMLGNLDAMATYVPPSEHVMLSRVPPHGSNITLHRTTGMIDLVVPSQSRLAMLLVWLVILVGAILFIVLRFAGDGVGNAPQAAGHLLQAAVYLAIFSIGGLLHELRRSMRVRLRMGRDHTLLERRLGALRFRKEYDEPITVIDMPLNDPLAPSRHQSHALAIVGIRPITFGHRLSTAELEWIAEEFDAAERDLTAPLPTPRPAAENGELEAAPEVEQARAPNR